MNTTTSKTADKAKIVNQSKGDRWGWFFRLPGAIAASIAVASAVISAVIWIVGYVATKQELQLSECRLGIYTLTNRHQVNQIVQNLYNQREKELASPLIKKESDGTITPSEARNLNNLRNNSASAQDIYKESQCMARKLETALATNAIWRDGQCVSEKISC